MPGGQRTVIRRHRSEAGHSDEEITSPRSGLLTERVAESTTDSLTLEQERGPFASYRRVLRRDGDHWEERTDYRLEIPWFGWLFAIPVRRWIGRRSPERRLWWAPPEALDQRQIFVLGLLAAASMTSAFVNTIFTQTVAFAADDFGVGNTGIGVAGSIVRAGILITIPLAVAADRIGRRRVITTVAWAAPLITALGAIAPSFEWLVASQAVGRPLGLALDFLIAVVAVEEMPRGSRAYAVALLAMASGLGAGIAVGALPLTDLGDGGWRLVYVVTLIWLVVAVDIARRLPETRRFSRDHTVAPPLDRGRFIALGVIAIGINLFVAPASFFQNRYLDEIRDLSGSTIALFTLTTSTPAALGLVIGGQLADRRGRRGLIALTLPVATAGIWTSFSVGGSAMWVSAFAGGFLGGIAYPALAVYRAELFPTGNRGRAAGLLTVLALLGGIGGLLAAGTLLDSGWSHARVMGVLTAGQLVVVHVVWRYLPETARRDLDELNPVDALSPPASTQ
ncbi:MAG: MFS transporter [Ilumatobacteraceae bacterium]|nr:MFS transporter [Ilumatobacteraceae bacterium]MBL6759836.1 MFS transporter [Ilumatobacteraceae bacterium]